MRTNTKTTKTPAEVAADYAKFRAGITIPELPGDYESDRNFRKRLELLDGLRAKRAAARTAPVS